MTIRIPRTVLLCLLTIAVCMGSVGIAYANEPQWFKDLEDTSNQIATTQVANDPYPVSQVTHSLERKNLVRRLIEFNNPNKIGYVYILSFGKFVGYYTVKGKVSSTQSSLTNPDQHWANSGNDDTVVDSIGDDGTFGTEEGGDAGIFFYTTAGVLVETDSEFLYAAAPLSVDVPNLSKKG